MLNVLVEGVLTTAPVARTSGKNQTFATANMRAVGEDGQPVTCSLIAFNSTAVESLIGLTSGDAVAVTGEASVTHWQSSGGTYRVGLRIAVSRALSIVEAGKRRGISSKGVAS